MIEQGISIDRAELVATKNGEPLDLTYQELRILNFFIARKGEVVTRTELFAKFWPHNAFSNIADVYVNYLRQKIGKDAIVTVRGTGYVFQEVAGV